MNNILLVLFVAVTFIANAQDKNRDVSTINKSCSGLEHLVGLFTIYGSPQVQNSFDKVSVLVNHGYCVGYSTIYNQPVWAAYQVSAGKEQTDYERPQFFVDDVRLPAKNRIGTEGYGNEYDKGHMIPNAAINRQYGKLAQMETFLASNISPQKAKLNRGVWQKLEAAIRDKYCNGESESKHLWVIVGPIFSDTPMYLERKNKTRVAIPDAFYCIIVRPTRHPFAPTNAEYMSFIFPQELEQKQAIDVKFLVSINDIEAKTGINFFPEFTQSQEKKIENSLATEIW